MTTLKCYPSDNETIARELASVLRLQPQNLVLANGSTELLTWIDCLFITESLATPIPTHGRAASPSTPPLSPPPPPLPPPRRLPPASSTLFRPRAACAASKSY